MSRASYQRGLRAEARGLWSGAISFDQFFDGMQTVITRNLTQAWNAGARMFGVQPGEQTSVERVALRQAINREIGFINGLAEFIEERSREVVGPGKRRAALSQIFNRLNTWTIRWVDVRNQATLMSAADGKLIWIFDPRKENCRTCAALNNKVKRQSVWLAAGVRPQNAPNRLIECEGWLCGCQLLPTDLPLSRGPLPGLP